MILSSSTEVLAKELLHQTGRLASRQEVVFQSLPGNPGRRDQATLRRFAVASQGSMLALLTVGKDLTELRRRSDLFSSAYPDLACPVFAHGSTEGEDVLLAEYFDGSDAVRALSAPEIGLERVLSALELIAKRLDQSVQSSTQEEAIQEVRELCSRVLQIEHWTAADRGFLVNVVFPHAERHLINQAPCRRVSNGDFTLGNILLNADGAVRVIDYEQAAMTHFFAEDWLRLTYWNAPDAVRRFALSQIQDLCPVRLYLWLKQLVFESAVILPAKARIDLRHWSGKIRQSIEQENNELKQSLFWPAAESAALAEFCRLHSDASHNFGRALDLHEFSEREVARLEDRIYQRDLKIRHMQASFSWRATAWLRALRRRFIDPYFGQPPTPKLSPPVPAFPFSNADFIAPPASKFHYHINSPHYWPVTSGDIRVSGWIFANEPIVLRRIRARIGTRIYAGEYGLERPDFVEKFLPQAYSGFRIEVPVQETDQSIDLEVADDSGEWYLFFTKKKHTAHSPYAHWVTAHDTLTPAQLAALGRKAASLPSQPLISVIMPVHNTPEQWLTKAIESVRDQAYPHWELCIADDASTLPHVRPLLEAYMRKDARIKVVCRPQNGHISATSNSALELAAGEFTALLDHDDELAPHALLCVAEAILARPGVEVIYSDEDKIDEHGFRFDPHFKPDWNPDLLTSQNYFSHLTAYRTATLRAIGGFRPGFEGSQDWDVALRMVERVQPQNIHHIPRVLYHWRAIDGSTATHPDEKNYAGMSARRALEEHFSRTGRKASLHMVRGGHWHVQYPRPEPPPLVTIIIPTRNGRKLLTTCVESIFARTSYPNFEILIADNDSDDPGLAAFYEGMKARGRFEVLSCPGPFNFSAINNRAVQHARGKIIGLLNNDLEIIHAEWLDEMVSHAVRPEIGAVGAKLFYPNFRIQHAGVITGLGGVAGHAFKGLPRQEPGLKYRPHLVQNLSAVTAACLIIRKSVYLEAGGFNEDQLKVAFNDVDFCLKVQALGYRNLYTPFAELIHHESASRGTEDTPEKIRRFAQEVEFIKGRWGDRLLNDPAYNPNFSLNSENFALAYPPRVPPLVQA
ncbi:MAG TPA: glycosyltransferase family 2 protein [Opitutaceae bacterium]|jgi:glycosyltransferase involved in cell wall biosynthesis|nr:glycosyltransferase family 2 protein [Opitutaceae bacterium]